MAEDATGGHGAGVIGVAAVLAVLVVIAVVVVVLGRGDDGAPPADQLTATPMATAVDATATPAPSPVEGTAPDDDAPIATPTSRPTATDAQPGDAEAAAAAEAIRPEGAEVSEVVIADLDDDGRIEVVVASVLGGRSRIDVASWDDGTYALSFSGDGGAAEALAEVRVEDINGTPETREIVVRQTSGAQGESISVWGTSDGEVVPLPAVDGCWDGSHTYGIVGATLEGQRITATCDGSPDPIISWPSDTYSWDPELEAFAYERTLQP